MAVNEAAKHNRSAQHGGRATSMSSGTYADVVNHEELLLNTSLGTIGNSNHITSSLFTGHSPSWQSEVPSVSPIQVDDSPPDSQEVVGKTDAPVNGRWYRSNTVPQHGATSAANKEVATTVTESMLRRESDPPPQFDRNTAANKFKPKDVTLKGVDTVKRDHHTRKMTILFIGNIAVGKTSLINRIRHKQFQPIHNATIDMTPTIIGATVRGQNYIVRLLDTAGEERFQSIMQSFYRHGNGAMIVYDLTDYSSFDKIIDWNLTLQKHCTIEDNIKFPTILLGNKADKDATHTNGSEIADDLKMDGFFKTSARNGEGITDAAKMMINLIDLRCRNDLKFLSQDGQVIQLSSQNNHQSKPPRYFKC